MRRKTYAKLRLAALIILGAETVAFCVLLLANSHANPFALSNFHTQPGLKSNGAKHSNLGEMGYGNWDATRQDFATVPTCMVSSGSCIETESVTDLGNLQDYKLAISLADAIQSSYDTVGYQPGGENNTLTGGLASGKWLSDGVFGVTTNAPFGQFLPNQIDVLGSPGDPRADIEIITSTSDQPGNVDVDPSDPAPFNITLDPALSTVPALQVHSVPEPMSLSLFGAGFIGAALLRRRKSKVA